MPHDPVKMEETISWLRKAKDDLRAASVDLAADPALVEDALFHYQQAVEKTMKAFLTWHDQPFRKTHSLTELGVICSRIDPGLEAPLRRTAGLSQYATIYRYPGEAMPPTEDEAAEARELAAEVLGQVLIRLPGEIAD